MTRALPSENKDKTHCLRGHPLSGTNLSLRSNGARVCVICQRNWARFYQTKYRKQGVIRYGYTANVLKNIGREKLENAFEAVRETGLIKSADAVIGHSRRRALVFFHPKVAAVLHKAAAEHKKSVFPVRVPSIRRITFGADLLDRINAAVPRHLPRDQRDDVIGEIALAVSERLIRPDEIEAHIKKFVSASYRADHNKFGPYSLDMPAFREGTVPLVETISQGLWQ